MSADRRTASEQTRYRLRRGREDGQSIVELLIVVPVVFALLLVILDGGLAFDRREAILHSLREAGRSAAAGDQPSAVVNVAVAQSDGILDPSNVSVCYMDGPDSGGYPGDVNDEVRVSISYQYQTVFGSGLMTDLGVGSAAFNISPKAEAVLLKPVAGAPSC